MCDTYFFRASREKERASNVFFSLSRDNDGHSNVKRVRYSNNTLAYTFKPLRSPQCRQSGYINDINHITKNHIKDNGVIDKSDETAAKFYQFQ